MEAARQCGGWGLDESPPLLFLSSGLDARCAKSPNWDKVTLIN